MADDDINNQERNTMGIFTDVACASPSPMTHGTKTPSRESVEQYFRELEMITVAQQHAEAQSAGLFIG